MRSIKNEKKRENRVCVFVLFVHTHKKPNRKKFDENDKKKMKIIITEYLKF